MQFKVIAKVEKEIWSNQYTFLYAVIETYNSKSKKWSIFTKEPLSLESVYTFEGYVNNSKDKKTDQWKINFNAENCIPNEDVPF